MGFDPGWAIWREGLKYDEKRGRRQAKAEQTQTFWKLMNVYRLDSLAVFGVHPDDKRVCLRILL